MRSFRSQAVALATTALLVGLGGCASEPKAPEPYMARPVVELARWQAFDGSEPVAVLLHLEILDPSGPVPFYQVQDLQGRWLGHATEQGRFSRRVPFQEGEEDLGVWSLATGVGKLVEAKGKVELRPVPAEAAARRR